MPYFIANTTIISIALMLYMSAVTVAFKTIPTRGIKKHSLDYFLSRTIRSKSLRVVPNSEPFYITTPIYYVNGLPHLGHAYTSVAADVIARFQRKDGREVFFLSGTDEHGQKVQQSAEIAGKTPQQFSDDVALKFKDLLGALNCSNNDFIRTTEERHKTAVADLWKRLCDNNQVYLGAYEGWYSVRDETFYAESELENGKAPTGAEVQWVKEESYFFRLSQWTQPLLDFYEKYPDFIGPDGRRNEVVSFVSQEGGLRDLSISRTTFSWGIPVPDNPQHVVYVWLDALTNYLSALGYPTSDNTGNDNSGMKKFWPANVHVVGKDILRFHAVFWPAFLMAAGLEPPKRVYAHGWWTKDGEKMSKSIGNVLDPNELIAQYGVDFLRYFMIAEVPFGNDGDFSHDALISRVNTNLANEVGNLAQRALVMVYKNCEGRVPEPGPLTDEDKALLHAAEEALGIARDYVHTQSLHRMVESIMSVARLGNKYIDVQAPWALKKTDIPRMCTVLYVLTETVRRIAILLEPVIPGSCNRLLDQIGMGPELRTFASISQTIPPGTPILSPSPIFPRIETKKDVKVK